MYKKTKRKGFNFFRSYYDVYNELDDKSKVMFMDALLDRQFLGVKPNNLTGMAKFAYISQTNSIDSQVKGYEDKTGLKLTPNDGGNEAPTVGELTTPTEQVEVEGKEEVQVEGKTSTEGVEKSTLHKKLVEVFFSYYHNEKGIKYEFQNSKDGTAIKNLIQKIKRQFKSSHKRDPTEEEVVNSFDWLIRNVNEWVYNNFTIANINGQFNQIIDFAKNGNKKKTKSRLSPEQLKDIIDGN